jgi:hypothetical protein
MSAAATGGCLCGAVRYRVQGALRDPVACHCAQCRRTSGHHVAAASAVSSDVRVDGGPVWYESSPGVRRGFCGVCGSNLFWERVDSGRMSIFAGSLDAPTGLSLRGHIFVGDKGDYYTIADGAPQALGDDAEMCAP